MESLKIRISPSVSPYFLPPFLNINFFNFIHRDDLIIPFAWSSPPPSQSLNKENNQNSHVIGPQPIIDKNSGSVNIIYYIVYYLPWNRPADACTFYKLRIKS